MGVLALLTLVIVAAVAYAHSREGLFTALGHSFSTLIAGLLAFQFWPMFANELQPLLHGTFLENFEDAIVLIGVFCLSVAILRVTASQIARRHIAVSPKIDQIGGAVFGAITGYLVSGLLVCVLQTLPWDEHFLGYQYDENGLATRIAPADQTWLRLMNRSHRGSFDNGEDRSRLLTDFSRSFAKERRSPPPSAIAPAPAPTSPLPPAPPSGGKQ